MLDRFDPRDDESRGRGNASERHRGSRGGGDREDVRDDEDRYSFGRQLDLPRGHSRM
jgi:hypothetical protein